MNRLVIFRLVRKRVEHEHYSVNQSLFKVLAPIFLIFVRIACHRIDVLDGLHDPSRVANGRLRTRHGRVFRNFIDPAVDVGAAELFGFGAVARWSRNDGYEEELSVRRLLRKQECVDRCNRMLPAWRDIQAELPGRLVHSRDVLVHRPQSVFQAAIVDELEAALEGKPRML